MADIKSYIKEKEKRERRQAGYKEKIMVHKLAKVYRVLLIAAAAVALIVIAVIQYQRHVYTDYETVSSISREKTTGSVDVRLGNSILTYSKDGAHCTDLKGNVTWNQTYEIQDIRLAVCGNTVAIVEYNGRSIYVQNSEKLLHQITTTMPIRNLAVSSSGRVTAVLADTDLTWIYTYDPGGNVAFWGRVHMDGSGEPTAISLSPNGELLAAAYMYVDAGVLKTNIVFYNFGSVGENNSDHIVSNDTYPDTIIPQIQFMNDDTAFAVGDNRLVIYKGSQKPTVAAGYMFDAKLRSVFYSDKYIGLVFYSEDAENSYRMDVYDTKAEKRGSYYFDIEYRDIFFEQEGFVVYNETECLIMTLDGAEKFNGSFSKAAGLVIPVGGSYRYALVTEHSIDTIQLK